MIILPTLFFTLYFEKAFYVALDTTGGFGDSILNGIIPVLLVWAGRYKLGLANEQFLVPGGKPLLLLVLLFFVSTLSLAILTQLGFLASIY